MEEDKKLTRRERRARERSGEKLDKGGAGLSKKIILIIGVLGLISIVGYSLYSSTPKSAPSDLPGDAAEDLGRDHIEDIAGISYSSNPPTSGPHFPIWAKRGAYDRLISDGYLIHSLEHGYVVISYNCQKLQTSDFSFVPTILAHSEPTEESEDSGELLKHMNVELSVGASVGSFTPDNPPEVEMELPQAFSTDACSALQETLSQYLEDWDRVVIVPRVEVDSLISLTAWARIDKMNEFDASRVENFISTFHNKGPEKTNE